uniref:PH domain-containing protein n=1 Tax=Oryzias melastigma TaxID=30732 RepID=A0A3B3C7M8_ORYME
ILCADNRKEMEEWMSALRSIQSRQNYESTQYSMDHFSGMHNWYACSHARPTYCNVCREALSGVTSHGLSCEVCLSRFLESFVSPVLHQSFAGLCQF